MLESAQEYVVARGRGNHADARIPHGCGAGAHIGASRFDIAPDAAEQIQFPKTVEAGLSGIELAVMHIETRQLLGGIQIARVAAAERHGWKLVESSQPSGRARRP